MKLHEKGKTSNSEWFGVEHYRIFHEMDLFRYVNMERLQMLYPDILEIPNRSLSSPRTQVDIRTMSQRKIILTKYDYKQTFLNNNHPFCITI